MYIGIDWSEQKHQVVFLNDAAAVVASQLIPHSLEGFLTLDRIRQRLGLSTADCLVALETAHNLLVDFLWERGYTQVYVVPPNVTRSCRGRYCQSGAHTDQSDALLLANLLRTDRHRFSPWRPDSPLTRQMRALVSRYLFLTRSNVRLVNRLRALLLRYYPAAVDLFSSLDGVVTLEFLRAFPTPEAATSLKWEEFFAFARQHHYTRPGDLRKAFARLQEPRPHAAPEVVAAYQEETSLLATLLLAGVRARQETLKQLMSLFVEHPDHDIFASLPGTGEFLAPALLVKFGDDRERFPTPASVQALAGSCPVTEASGKGRRVRFRQGCDREFRYICQQWAWHSLNESVWASTYYEQALERGLSESHALRCLVNRWLVVAWRLWQDRVPYDEAYHLRQVVERRKPR
jgi:transposase